MSETSQATLITTGMLPFLLLVSAALTAPVSLALLALYRRAVIRAMAAGGNAAATAPPAGAVRAAAPRAKLQLEEVAAAAIAPSAARASIRRSLLAATTVYVLAGFAYALVLGAAWMIFTLEHGGFVLPRFLWLLSCYAWPTALAVGLIVAVNRTQRVAVAAAYFAMLLAVVSYGLARNAELTVGQLATFWLITNAPATVLLLAYLHRRVRAVGPLVLAFMVVAVTGSQAALSLVGSSDAWMHGAVSLGQQIGVGGTGMFYLTMLAGLVPAAVLGWLWLGWLGRRHLARRTSDQALTLDAMWLMFGVVQSVTLAFEGWAWVFTGLVAFAAYKAVARLGFALAGLGKARRGTPSLLLLRVFALGTRSERLFDALAKRWLRAGDISLIAGPDLATTTVEPHEFLDFVGGRLSRQFVRDEADLERRFAARALGPDPDGRYRVNEFFCHADTWQAAMRRLAASADAVLMDLRSFSATNQGCQYELQQLLEIVALERVVFLIDESTDRGFLEQVLGRLWRSVSEDSPNHASAAPRARVLVAAGSGLASLPALLELLARAAAEPAGKADEALQGLA